MQVCRSRFERPLGVRRVRRTDHPSDALFCCDKEFRRRRLTFATQESVSSNMYPLEVWAHHACTVGPRKGGDGAVRDILYTTINQRCTACRWAGAMQV